MPVGRASIVLAKDTSAGTCSASTETGEVNGFRQQTPEEKEKHAWKGILSDEVKEVLSLLLDAI